MAKDEKIEAKASTAPVDVEAMRKQIRAEEAEKLRAESAERSKADHVEVVCSGDNVHTSKGKMVKGMTKHLPKSEATRLSKKGHVKFV